MIVRGPRNAYERQDPSPVGEDYLTICNVGKYTKFCRLCQMLKTRTHPGHAAKFTLKSEIPGEQICMDVMELDEDFLWIHVYLSFG